MAAIKLTNRSNLPEAIVAAVSNDPYSRGDAEISVTGLLKPPRMRVLEEKHKHEIVDDVSNRIWSLLGQSVHTILERANVTGIAERRLSMEIEGWRVSGQVDHFETGMIRDYKVTSVHKLLQGNLLEWEQQLNCYSALLRHHGEEVSALQVIAILRDWSKHQGKRDHQYPQAQVVNIPVPLWKPERAIEFLREKVQLHKRAQQELPECSAEERWAKPDVWAVMKAGRKSAVKLFQSESEALDLAASENSLSVVHRRGESIRCSGYCLAFPFCSQGKKLINQNQERENENVICSTN